jgi:hypothetical protein
LLKKIGKLAGFLFPKGKILSQKYENGNKYLQAGE